MSEPVSDERLAEIEARWSQPPTGLYPDSTEQADIRTALELIAEVKRSHALLAEIGRKPNGWWCDDCDRIDPFCPHCNGSGGDAARSEAAGAYALCEECGGDGRQHRPEFYGLEEGEPIPPWGERAKLRARVAELEGQVQRVRKLRAGWAHEAKREAQWSPEVVVAELDAALDGSEPKS